MKDQDTYSQIIDPWSISNHCLYGVLWSLNGKVLDHIIVEVIKSMPLAGQAVSVKIQNVVMNRDKTVDFV